MLVSVWHTGRPAYSKIAPFHPSEDFPEKPSYEVATEENLVYRGVRELFHLHRLDDNHYGTPLWNPLGEFIRPGMRVLLKPNLITERHPRDPNGWQYVLTHGSLIRAVADYVFLALKGKGTVVVADAPQTDSSFVEIVSLLGLDTLREYYTDRKLDFRLVDLRKYEWTSKDDVVVSRRELSGDPEGYIAFDLAERSLFYQHKGEGKYYGADYDSDVVNSHHHDNTHEYLVSASAINCDVFINLPKLKTHKKTGVTLSLKNLVGINGDKNYLPHYTAGSPSQGGDQFAIDSVRSSLEGSGLGVLHKLADTVPVVGPSVYRFLKKTGSVVFGKTSQVVRSGNWYGNDTTWRMCLDLNRILFYGNPDGSFRSDSRASRKPYLTIIDGMISGQGDGPIDADPCNSGVLLFGADPAVVDCVAATLMGFDPEKLPLIAGAFTLDTFRITDTNIDQIDIASNKNEWNGTPSDIALIDRMKFRPHFGWTGAIEAVNYDQQRLEDQ